MDPFEPIRPFLPFWTRLATLTLWVPAAFATGWACAALARRVAGAPYRRLVAGTPWEQRARHAYPARMATALTILLAVVVLSAVSTFYVAGPSLSIVPAPWLGLVVCICAQLGGASVSSRLAGELGLGSRRIRELARDLLVVIVLLAPHIVLALGAAPAIALPLDAHDALRFGAVVLLFACIAGGGALHVLRWLGLVESAPERLRLAVQRAAHALATAEPPVEVVRWGAANAIAFPLAGRLAFSSRALEVLGDDELCAIAAHEIGHLREPVGVRAARAAMLFALLPLSGIVVVFQLWGPVGALGVVGTIFALMLTFRGVARRMEERADRSALCGADASSVYARALERLYEANLTPAVMAGRPVHPHLYDRLIAAGVPPDFLRPDPPSQRRMWAGVAAATALLALVAFLLTGPPFVFELLATESERASNLDLAFGPDAGSLLRRAMLEDSRGNSEAALAFASASTALEPDFIGPPALRAMVLAREGRCEEAAQQFLQAEELNLDGAGDDWLVSAQASLEACEPPPALGRSPV